MIKEYSHSALLIIPYKGFLHIDTFHLLHPSTAHHEEKYLQLSRKVRSSDDDKRKPLVLQAIDYLVITDFEMLAAVIIATWRPDVHGGGGSQVNRIACRKGCPVDKRSSRETGEGSVRAIQRKCRMSWGEAGFWWVESSATPTESQPKAIFMFST